MSRRLGGKGQQQVRLAAKMIGLVLVTWLGLTMLFSHAGGEKEGASVGNAAYAALQLFFVNVGYESFERTGNDAWGWVLLAARYVVPWMITILAVLAVVDALRVRLALFFRRAFRFLPYGKRPLVLIVGLGEKGLAMVQAERGRAKGSHIVVIERDADNPGIQVAKAAGATVWIGEAGSETDVTLCCWKRPDRIFALTGSDQQNLLVVKIAKRLFSKEKMKRLEVFALIQDLQERRNASSMDLFNEDTDGFWTNLMNYEEDVAAYTLHKHPVLPVGGDAPRILVVGGGRLGYALVVELLKLGHFMQQDRCIRLPQIVVVDSSEVALARFRGLERVVSNAAANKIRFAVLLTDTADVNGWTYDDYSALRGGVAFSHIFVTLGSEVRNFTIAQKFAEWERFCKDGLSKDAAVVLTYSYEDWKATPTDAPNQGKPLRKNVADFKVLALSDVYSKDALDWRDKLRAMARRINGCYNAIDKKIRAGEITPADVKDTKRLGCLDLGSIDDSPWAKTSQRHRDASLDQAKHLAIKNAQLGELSLDDPIVLQNLAETEHRRWNAAQLLDGNALNKKKDPKALTHPNLVPFDRLDFATQCYDYAFVYNLPKLCEAPEKGSSAA